MNQRSSVNESEETDLRFFELYQVALRMTHTPMQSVEQWRDSAREIAAKLLEGAFYQGAPVPVAAGVAAPVQPGQSSYGPAFTGIADAMVGELLNAAIALTIFRAANPEGKTIPIADLYQRGQAETETVRVFKALDDLLVAYLGRPVVRR